MLQYIIKLENGNYMKYDQTDSYELLVEGTPIINNAETFNTYDEAEEFAKCINNRRDCEFVILSYEDAVSIVEINSEGEWLTEKDINVLTQNIDEYLVNVTKDGYVGHSGWEESIYINTEKDEDYEDIFKQYIGKKVKLTIEVME